MDATALSGMINTLASKKSGMHGKDFLLTWEKTRDELDAVLLTAEILKGLRDGNHPCRLWDSGIAVSIFRDNSTRTRFSFASASNLLGLAVQDFDEKKSQVAHGETIRETAVMISFLAEAIGIRDDIFLGEGDKFQREFGSALDQAFRDGVIPQRPAIVNLQSDIDHPTQAMADFMYLTKYFGGIDKLKGKKIAMSWAYSPSYGKPLSVPQGIIGLMTRFGMDVTLAYPEGYSLLPDVVDLARRQAKESGGSFSQVGSMEEAFRDADIVYPKSWAPFSVMEERTKFLSAGDDAGLKALEKRCLANNARFKDWECDEAKMKLTRGGKALYQHCLPADITGVSCTEGEVAASVFDRYRDDLYRQAGWKPYVIAAMILLSRCKDPAATLRAMLAGKAPRFIG